MWNPIKEFAQPARAKRVNGRAAPMHEVPPDDGDRKQTGHPPTGNGHLVSRQAGFLRGPHDLRCRDYPLVKNEAHCGIIALGANRFSVHKHYAFRSPKAANVTLRALAEHVQ